MTSPGRRCPRLAIALLLVSACGSSPGGPGGDGLALPEVAAADVPPDAVDAPTAPTTYRNPILPADYSDPDAVRVGDEYWLTSSSFGHVPGLPLLHSRDLVSWTLEGHALPRLVPEEAFAAPRHGKGVWAPSLRFHAGRYRIYYPDPETGLYVITAGQPTSAWTSPVLVQGGQGLIDPCPFWDDDGTPYLIHAWAKSFAGFNNVLTLLRLDADGTRVAEDLGVVIDGDAFPGTSTLEGPKLYRRNGWTYVFAPAGGVATGWQMVFRARDLRGPYEARIVLEQGATAINGPHQGALVDTPSGEWWFLHFQDRGVYGRVVHLQPVAWVDDWPVIGEDPDGDGTGQPVLEHARPDLPAQPPAAPATSDDFEAPTLGLQWQWQANPDPAWMSLSATPGSLRLAARPEPKPGNLYEAPHLLLQKLPAEAFAVTATLDATYLAEGDRAGLIVFGYDYAWLGVRRTGGTLEVVQAINRGALLGKPQVEVPVTTLAPAAAGRLGVRVEVREGGLCRFWVSVDGAPYERVGATDFQAVAGRWVGAKVGLFASSPAGAPGGHVDVAEVLVTE